METGNHSNQDELHRLVAGSPEYYQLAHYPDRAAAIVARLIRISIPGGTRRAHLSIEQVLAADASEAFRYARDFVHDRWPEGEPAILTRPYIASEYAEQLLLGRWPEAEDIIAADYEAAYHYAHWVLKSRWPKGDLAIFSEPLFRAEYFKTLRFLDYTGYNDLVMEHGDWKPC